MRDYFYTNTSEDYRYRKELANFFEEYPKLTYNSNWSYFIGLSYNKNNKTYKNIEDPEFKLSTYKQYDYIDEFTGKKREEINSKLTLDFGVRNDVKNVKTLYIANPLLKSITSYKLPELIALASELNIDINDIKKVKKDIYNHMYKELNK